MTETMERSAAPIETRACIEGETFALDLLTSAALGRMTRQLTHELRNALTGVRCYLELLSGELPEALESSRADVELSVDRITDLATGWSDLASGRTATGYINGALQRIVALYSGTGYSRSLSFEECYDEAVNSASVDAVRLQSVLFALLADLVADGPGRLRVATTANGNQAVVQLQLFPANPTAWRPPMDLRMLGEVIHSRLERIEVPGRGYRLTLEMQAVDEF